MYDNADFSASFRCHGVVVLTYDHLIDTPLFQLFKAESRQQYAHVWSCLNAENVDTATAQKNRRADLTQSCQQWLRSNVLRQQLRDITGEQLAFSASSSCFTYYKCGRDHLDWHTDNWNNCFVTLLLYLDVYSLNSEVPSAGMYLQIAGDKSWNIRSRSGRLVLLLGSQLWHRRPPLAHGESIAMISACFSHDGSAHA